MKYIKILEYLCGLFKHDWIIVESGTYCARCGKLRSPNNES